MAQGVDADGNPVTMTSQEQAAAELLGEESTSATNEEDAAIEESADPSEEASVEGNDELTAEEIEALAEETTGDTSAKGLKKLEDFVNERYKGDVDAFLNSWHENNKNRKEEVAAFKAMQSRLDELTELVQAGRYAEEEDDASDPPEVSADADIAFHNENIQSLELEIKQAQSSNQQSMQRIGQLTLEVTELKGELKRADDSEVSDLRQQIAAKDSEIRSLFNDANAADKEARTLERKLKQEQRDLTQAEKNADKQRSDYRNSIKQQREAAKKLGTDARNDFASTATALIKKHAVPDDVAEDVYGTLKDRVSGILRSLGPDAPPQDIKAITEAVGDAYFKSQDRIARSKFSKVGKTKTAGKPNGSTRRTSPSTSPSPSAKDKPRRFWTQEDYDNHATKLGRYYDSL